MRTASEPLAARLNAEESKEREATEVSWNTPLSATSRFAPAVLVSVAAVQENFPVVTVYWRKELPEHVVVRPEPYVAEAEARPMTLKSPDTDTLEAKSALPVTENVPEMRALFVTVSAVPAAEKVVAPERVL